MPDPTDSPPIRYRSFINRDGTLAIKRIGTSFNFRTDTYHLLLSRPWWQIIALLFVAYFVVGMAFGGLYLAGGDCIQGARPGHLLDYYFFSVQTLATIGYGSMVPVGNYANSLVSLEAFIGLVSFAVMSGLMFAKFSVPNARILFTRNMLINQRDGQRVLVFRMANARGNQIIEAHCNVTLARIEPTETDSNFRRMHRLPLVVADSPLFAITFMATHIIDEKSPLFGVSAEEMIERNYQFMVTLMGLDSLISQTVHARYGYVAEDVVWDHRFLDTIRADPEGNPVLDYRQFHLIEPFVLPPSRNPDRPEEG